MSIPELHAGPRMSQAVVHGSTIYLAGHVALTSPRTVAR